MDQAAEAAAEGHAPKWERLASRYERHHLQGARDEFIYGGHDRAAVIAELVGFGQKVLDLGCRDGALTQHYLTGNDVTGVDIDRRMLDAAARRGIKPVWWDIGETLPFEDEQFDRVVLSEVLEHVSDPLTLLPEIARVLRGGGALVGSVPNAFRLKNRLLFMGGRDFELDPTHFRQYSPKLLTTHLSASGLQLDSLRFVIGRFVRLHPRLFANTMVFSASRR